MVQRVEESLSSLQHCEELLKEERERERGWMSGGVENWLMGTKGKSAREVSSE